MVKMVVLVVVFVVVVVTVPMVAVVFIVVVVGGGGVGVGGGGGGGIVTHRGGEVVAVYGDRAGRFDSGSGSRSRGGRRDCGGILGKKTCVTNIKSCLSVLGMSK